MKHDLIETLTIGELFKKMTELSPAAKPKPPQSNDDFLTNEEFLKLMKVSRRTAMNWRSSGKVAYSKVGRLIYYRMKDVQKLLDEHFNPSFARRK